MKKLSLSTAALLSAVLSSVAVADVSLDEGSYVGIGFGLSSYDDDNLVKKNFLGDTLDKSDIAYRMYGGWLFNKIVGVEIGYSNYGSFQLGTDTIKANSFNIAANLGYTFLDGQLRPFILIGLSYVNSDYPDATTYDIDANSVGVHTGIGIAYLPKALSGVGFRFAIDDDFYTLDYIASSNTKNYTQTMASVYLGVDYNF